MTKIDIFSGFLGAGKTTLIKKLIREAYEGEKLVLIENEFGEIAVDGGFLQDAGVEITEMNSGCICCSLVGDFADALKKVIRDFAPDRILIEPSGVGKLSDVIRAVKGIDEAALSLNSATAVVDANKCKMYMKNFGEFFNDQVEHAGALILSRTDSVKADKLAAAVELLREHNPEAVIVTTPWNELSGAQILAAMEQKDTLTAAMEALQQEKHHHHHDEECSCGHDHHEHHHHGDECCCGHDHHEHHHGDECCCGHDHHEHHHHDDECCCGHDHHEHHHGDECCCGHEHHEHHHDGECCCGHDHHEHHHHDGECCCGHDHHEHHHGDECSCGHEHHEHGHHHADEVFMSWGIETTHKFSAASLEEALNALADEERFGAVLRAKGIVQGEEGNWFHFDLVPGEVSLREGGAAVTGRLCVIGAKLNEDTLKALFPAK
ncbi:MAG: GTP-binding protein [Clostridia bacterium]|nr:GTP-binding protein [Clostridia bacterium]